MWTDDWGTMIWGGLAIPGLGPLGLAFLFGAIAGIAGFYFRKQVSPAALRVAVISIALLPLVASAAVPHLFTNGTIADADEVNENFGSITADFTKYQLTRGSNTVGTTTPVPAAVITELCEDDDGCRVRLVSRARLSAIDFPNPAPPALLYLNTAAPQPRWLAVLTNASNRSGTDGNGGAEHVTSDAAGDCFFTDGEYTNFTASDGASGFNLLVWTGGSYVGRDCQLTITD